MGNLANSYATTPVSEYDATKVATYNAALQILDSAIAGRLAISTTGGTTTLTGTPAAPQAQNLFLDVSGTLTSNATIEIPVAAGTGRNRLYVVKNGTTGAFTLTVKKVGGTGVTVPQGSTALLLYDDSDIAKILDVPTAGSWTSWTPSWTNLTIGNATVVGKYIQIGKIVHVRLSVVLGNTSSVTGDPTFTLPVTRVAYGGTAGITSLGNCALYDQSATTVYYGHVINLSTTTGAFRVSNTAGTYDTATSLSGTIPFTWTNPDEIAAVFTYEAA